MSGVGNEIGSEGMHVLASVLPQMTQLSTLDVSGMCRNDDGDCCPVSLVERVRPHAIRIAADGVTRGMVGSRQATASALWGCAHWRVYSRRWPG